MKKNKIKARVELWDRQEPSDYVTYLFESQCHAYVCQRQADILYLADGANLCKEGGAWGELEEIIGHLELNIITLQYHQQIGGDDCACSAVGIAHAFAANRFQHLWAPQGAIDWARTKLDQKKVGGKSTGLNRRTSTCPSCNRRFNNGRALSQHHRRAHGGTL